MNGLINLIFFTIFFMFGFFWQNIKQISFLIVTVLLLSSCATEPSLKQVKGFCDADVLKYKLRTDSLFLEIYCKETHNY